MPAPTSLASAVMGNELTLPATTCPHALASLPPADDYHAASPSKEPRRRHSLPEPPRALHLQGDDSSTADAPDHSQSGQRSRGRSKPMNYRLKWPTCVLIESNSNSGGGSVGENGNGPKRRGRKRKHPESAPIEAASAAATAAAVAATAAATPLDEELCHSSNSSLNSSLASTGRQTKRRRKMAPASSAASLCNSSSNGSVAGFLENCDPLASPLPPPPPPPPPPSGGARLPNLHAVMRRFDGDAKCPFAYAWDEEARDAQLSVSERRQAYKATAMAAAAAAAAALASAGGGRGGRRRSVVSRNSAGEGAGGSSAAEVPRILARKRGARGPMGLLVSWD